MENLQLNFSGRRVRIEVVNGREYLVAPMTMIVPGVLNGSKGPLYYPPDEVSKNYDLWNGMPLTYNHPMDGDKPISAKTPGILSKVGLGTVYNARIGSNGKLQAEAWFDVERTNKVDNRISTYLRAGKSIGLSTGLFTDNEERGGTYQGRTYTHIARNYRPDHLAILVDIPGACSLQDGCGVLNHKGEQEVGFRPTANLCDKSKKMGKKKKAKMAAHEEEMMDDVEDESNPTDNNCGVGSGGFQPGNKCAKGGGGGSQEGDKIVGALKKVRMGMSGVHLARELESTPGALSHKALKSTLRELEASGRIVSTARKGIKTYHHPDNAPKRLKKPPTANNCGSGAGGFKPGNKCAIGGGGGMSGGSKKPRASSGGSNYGKDLAVFSKTAMDFSTSMGKKVTTDILFKKYAQKIKSASKGSTPNDFSVLGQAHREMVRVHQRLAKSYLASPAAKKKHVEAIGLHKRAYTRADQLRAKGMESKQGRNRIAQTKSGEFVLVKKKYHIDKLLNPPPTGNQDSHSGMSFVFNERSQIMAKLTPEQKTATIDRLIFNCDCGKKENAKAGGPWKEEDREGLNQLSDNRLVELDEVRKTNAANEAVANAARKGFTDRNGAENYVYNEQLGTWETKPAKKPAEKAPTANSAEEIPLERLPKSVQAILNNWNNHVKSTKESLIKKITANSRNKFSKDQLEAMELDMLEPLAASLGEDKPAGFGAPPAHYLGANVPAANQAGDEDDLNDPANVLPIANIDWAKLSKEHSTAASAKQA